MLNATAESEVSTSLFCFNLLILFLLKKYKSFLRSNLGRFILKTQKNIVNYSELKNLLIRVKI
jgi:hypothetical protein